MKRSTLVVLGIFAVLLVAWLAKGMKSAPQGPAPLAIEGYAGNVSEQDFRTSQKDKLPAIQKLTLKKKGETWTLTQVAQELPKDVTPDTSKPLEAKWTVARQKGSKSSDAKGQPYRANAMAEVFGRAIHSSFGKEVKAAELAEYGLDADHAIEVEATGAKGTFKLRIGNVDKPQDGAEPSTWVQDPGKAEVVYQVVGRDLRAPFDVAWSDLRDRGLLTLDLAALDRIETNNPQDLRAANVVVSRAALAAGQKREAGDGWSIATPQGYQAGDVGEWAKSIERLSANEFVDASEVAEKKLDTGLDDPKAARLTLSEGPKKTVLVFGKVDEASAQKDVWLKIEGRDDLYKIASYSRDQVLQKLDQIRNRALLGQHKGKEASSFSLTGPDGTLQASKQGDKWALAGNPKASSAAIESCVGDRDSIKVDFAADVTPGAAGVDAPEVTLTLQFADGPWLVALTKEKDSNSFGRAGAAAGQGDVFKLATWSAGRLKKKAADFEEKADSKPAGAPAGLPPGVQMAMPPGAMPAE
ncbi:MAG: DUF4340 domain-containing protein [Deltaproteobacteria bacterium]|nr:DUF4340 domain-containing protein [Deltaproteobacteria bacterium]